ncbi:KIR protein [Plasmodium coatneyi]|uniref:KIR protein n=1 Tax=Plasmodium coatneyi TaxID=208452 RepID=A0A1B1E7S9_9APIC|nr:KIR protein [Plasmodium coatneyi]ANQ10819.1 KIR protein [Plasmodium coatneyi]
MYKEVSCTEEVLCIKNIGKKPQINEKWLQRQIYNKLKQGPEKCGEDSSTTKMKMTLSSSIGEENVKKIIKALCYINGRRGNENAGSEEYSMGCKFLYYHVGDILSEKYRDENFKENMEKIDAAIKANAHQLGKCFQDTYDGVEVFEASKILFDFKEDESTIKGQLQGQGRTRNCNAAYRAHWEKIQSTYETVRGKCMSRKESERCRKFKTLFPRYESTRILDLECKPVGTEAHKSRDQELEVISHPEDPEAKLQSTSSTKDATSTDITTTAISSTIATFIGIPMLSFFLYKVIIAIIVKI